MRLDPPRQPPRAEAGVRRARPRPPRPPRPLLAGGTAREAERRRAAGEGRRDAQATQGAGGAPRLTQEEGGGGQDSRLALPDVAAAPRDVSGGDALPAHRAAAQDAREAGATGYHGGEGAAGDRDHNILRDLRIRIFLALFRKLLAAAPARRRGASSRLPPAGCRAWASR